MIYRVCCLAGSASGLGTGGGFTYVLQDLRGGDPKALAQVVRRLTIAANQNPLLTRVFSTFSATNPSIYFDIDRDKAQVLGVQLNDVFQALQASLGGYYVNDLNLFGRRWQVNVQAEGNDRAQALTIFTASMCEPQRAENVGQRHRRRLRRRDGSVCKSGSSHLRRLHDRAEKKLRRRPMPACSRVQSRPLTRARCGRDARASVPQEPRLSVARSLRQALITTRRRRQRAAVARHYSPL